MTNYADNPGMVRADLFKPSGKWYMTQAIDMSNYYETALIHDAVRAALSDLRPEPHWWMGFTVVVAEPYHRHAHPVMLVGVA